MVEKTRVHLQIPRDLIEKVDKMAEINFQNRTQWIIQTIAKRISEEENSDKN